MEFWSKGLGKKTIALGLTNGESLVSEEALCLKGVMEEPVSWEYVMLIDETDIVDFLAILQEPTLAKYIHSSPNRWHLYAGLVGGGVQIAWRVIGAIWKRSFGSAVQEEKLVIQLPPPSMLKKKKRKKTLYRRRLSTTTLAAPRMAPLASTREAIFRAGHG
jgi:hypothetical protein